MISKDILKQLNSIYSKADLEKGIFPFVKSFYLHQFFGSKKDAAIENILQRLVARKALNAADTALLSFSVFEDETIYKQFLATLPKALPILIEKLLWVESMTDKEAEQLLHEPVTIPSTHSYGDDKTLKNAYFFFNVSKQYIRSYPPAVTFILSIHPLFKQLLVEFYPKPVHYYFIQTGEISQTRYRFTAENSILQEMPRLLSYYMQDGIKYSNGGRPADATLNRLQRSCGFTEFYAGDDSIGKVRTMLMAGLLFNFRINNINIDTVSVLKDLFSKNYAKLHTAQFILAQLKGWTYMDKFDYDDLAEHNFLEVLKQLPPDKWISAQNLVDFIKFRFIPVKPVNSWALNNRLYLERHVKVAYGNYKEKKYVESESNLLVHEPYIKGTIFLLASFGLTEIAFDGVNTQEYGKTFYSAYDGLQYFRLTALGAYVLGLSPSYTPSEAQQQNKVQFSEDSLMILAEGEMGVLEVMLSSFAEKAGNNRFKVSQGHFLKDCRGKKDIDNKIALLKKIVSAKLPPYWERQFKTWQENALKIQMDNTSQVFKISPDAKELQRLIAQDTVLKTLILKAEQFYMLVPANKVSRFKDRMKELGYLVE